MRDLYLHELDRAAPEERDALARNIYLALCRAWAWDHGVKADFEIVRRDPAERGAAP